MQQVYKNNNLLVSSPNTLQNTNDSIARVPSSAFLKNLVTFQSNPIKQLQRNFILNFYNLIYIYSIKLTILFLCTGNDYNICFASRLKI